MHSSKLRIEYEEGNPDDGNIQIIEDGGGVIAVLQTRRIHRQTKDNGEPRSVEEQVAMAERIVACVNACRGIPTKVVGEVLDRLFTAMMSSEARKHTQNNERANYLAMLDLNEAAVLMENAGVDLTDLLKNCRLVGKHDGRTISIDNGDVGL